MKDRTVLDVIREYWITVETDDCSATMYWYVAGDGKLTWYQK